MTKFPNPNKIPMTNTQYPSPSERIIRHFRQQSDTFLGFGHWDLGFHWDLETWSLGFMAETLTPRNGE
jgi:hypothetical protein